MLVDKDRSPQDVSNVSLNEAWEVQWWCTKFGCTETALRGAVGSVGPSAAEVARKLGSAQKESMKNTGED